MKGETRVQETEGIRYSWGERITRKSMGGRVVQTVQREGKTGKTACIVCAKECMEGDNGWWREQISKLPPQGCVARAG